MSDLAKMLKIVFSKKRYIFVHLFELSASGERAVENAENGVLKTN